MPTLFGLVLGLSLFFNIFDHRQQRDAIRRAVFMYPLAFSWWWIGGWFLKATDAVAQALVGNSAAIYADALTTQVSAILVVGVAGFLLYGYGGYYILIGIAVFIARRLGIYAYMVGMPVLFMLWIVPIKPIRGWAETLMGKFVPLTLATLPSALLLRLGAVFISKSDEIPNSAVKSLGTEFLGVFLGMIAIAVAGILPKKMMGMSTEVSRAIRTGSNIARGAASGARSGQRRAGSGTSGTQTTLSDGKQPISDRDPEEFKHTPKTSFSHPARSRRARQRRRAAKVGSGARTAASKSVDGLARTSRSYLRNRQRPGSTAAGMADDATTAAVQGTSERMQRIKKRMDQRGHEIRQKFTPGDDARRPTMVSATRNDDIDIDELGDDTDEQETVGPDDATVHRTDRSLGDVKNTDGSKQIGRLGSEDGEGRQAFDRNQSDYDIGGVTSGNAAGTPERDHEDAGESDIPEERGGDGVGPMVPEDADLDPIDLSEHETNDPWVAAQEQLNGQDTDTDS